MTARPNGSSPVALHIDETVAGGTALLRLTGEIALLTADGLLDRIRTHLDSRAIMRVVADLAAVAFMDSSGLRTLILARRHADSHAKVLYIRDATEHVARVVTVAGM